MTERVYDPDQANQALPLVRAIVDDLFRTRADQEAASKEYEALRGKPQADQGRLNRAHRAMRDAEDERGACLRELDELQIVVEDADLGRVGFPSELDGVAVYLSWHPDDERVEYFHAQSGAFANRKPLPVPVHAE